MILQEVDAPMHEISLLIFVDNHCSVLLLAFLLLLLLVIEGLVVLKESGYQVVHVESFVVSISQHLHHLLGNVLCYYGNVPVEQIIQVRHVTTRTHKIVHCFAIQTLIVISQEVLELVD